MSIVTKTGDDGSTGVIGGRVEKSHSTIHLLGEVDEVNAWIGLLRAEPLPDDHLSLLYDVQRCLFDLGAKVAGATGEPSVEPSELLTRLESSIEVMEESLPPLRSFILPGGSRTAAEIHLARAVCRRLERRLAEAGLEPDWLKLVNRLSDWLFCAARWMNVLQNREEVIWKR